MQVRHPHMQVRHPHMHVNNETQVIGYYGYDYYKKQEETTSTRTWLWTKDIPKDPV